MVRNHRFLKFAQWALILTGLTLLGFWTGVRIQGAYGKDADIRRFEAARLELQETTGPTATPTPPLVLESNLPLDMSLWAEGRIEEYQESLHHSLNTPLAILRIPKINLEVAVLSGTSELVLNRGVGHITGTPLPGEGGNIGIAGHRDGYFRGLKDVVEGDFLELETLTDKETYAITGIFLVDPPEVWVLEPTERPAITLVTCYPFYFVGSAPQRYIVRAERVGS